MEREQQPEHEQQADRMEEHNEQLGERIDDIESDWERKERDPAVPGARPGPDEEEQPVPGVNADEQVISEEGGP